MAAGPTTSPAAAPIRSARSATSNAGLELLQQANDLGLRIDCVVHGTGSTGTQAGLVVRPRGRERRHRRARHLRTPARRRAGGGGVPTASAAAEHVGIRGGLARDRSAGERRLRRPGYGIPTDGTIEAIRLAARHEGLLLDPVYTGKAMAGLIDLCRKGFFGKDQNVVFLHTGGAAALFAYERDFGS